MRKLEEILKQNQEQIIKDKALLSKLKGPTFSFSSLDKSLPEDFKQSGQDKLSQLTLDKVNQLKAQVEDKLNLTLAQLSSSDTCPNDSALNTILGVRDGILTQINNTVKVINRVKKGLNTLKELSDKQLLAITAATTIKTAAQTAKTAGIVAQTLINPVPGAAVSVVDLADTTIQISDDIIKLIQFDREGNPKIPKLKNQISTGLLYTNVASQSLLPLVDKLKSLDAILEKCGKKITSIPQDVTKTISVQNAVEQNPTLTNYQGFILEIVDKSFNNGLIQKVGVAKDSQGIILLQTQPSFTTNPDTLISELKFLIDKNNLKTY